MLSEKLGHRLDSPLSLLIKRGPLSKLSPTALTLTGLIINLIAAGFIIPGWWKTAAMLILVAGLFDMLDGASARTMEKTTPSADLLIPLLTAILIWRFLLPSSFTMPWHKRYLHGESLCGHLVGCVLIPYTRARAETIIPICNIGIMERAERILLIVAGCYFNLMQPVFLILAVLTHITVLQRIYYTWEQTQKQ